MECAFMVSIMIGGEFFLGMMVAITAYIFQRRKYNHLKYDYEVIAKKLEVATSRKANLVISERVEAGNQLIELIDHIITIEILSARKYEIFLNKQNPNLDVDRVIKDVAHDTFAALRKDLILDENGIFDKDWIMRYITKRTTDLYLSYMTKIDAGI